MELLPSAVTVKEDISVAKTAAAAGRQLRIRLRRRTRRRDPERQKKLDRAILNLERHGSILRSHLCRARYHDAPWTDADRMMISLVLSDLRGERRKLKKMRLNMTL